MPQTKHSKKPVEIILFHQEGCSHCTRFMPIWETMKADKKAGKNIKFEQYEESDVYGLPNSVKMVDGVDVSSLGWPTIKISINDDNYVYSGSRTPEQIYGSIIEHLKGNSDKLKNPTSVKMDDDDIVVSTRSDDISDALREFSDSESNQSNLIKFGGSKTVKNNAHDVKRIISDTDFKVFDDNDVQYSETLRRANIKK